MLCVGLQEWQNSIQKNAGLAFIELVNEGRYVTAVFSPRSSTSSLSLQPQLSCHFPISPSFGHIEAPQHPEIPQVMGVAAIDSQGVRRNLESEDEGAPLSTCSSQWFWEERTDGGGVDWWCCDSHVLSTFNHLFHPHLSFASVFINWFSINPIHDYYY